MKSFKYYLLGLSLLSIGFSSCGDDDMPEDTSQKYDNGVLIVNEGPFSGGSATLDYYDKEKDTLLRNVYSMENEDEAIGSILQSVTVIDDEAFLVVNNSAKIEVVDAVTMKYKNTITGVYNPRYMANLGNGNAVVSEWGTDGVSGQLKLVDLSNMVVVDSVSAAGPEQIVVIDDLIYVANSGGFAESNKVTVHNLDLTMTNEITVGSRAINLSKDLNDDIWVLSGGSFVTNDGASICKIVNQEVESCTDLQGFPSNLISNTSGTAHFYVENNEVKRIDLGIHLTTVSIDINDNETIYGLGYDESTQTLYVGTTVDFSSQSTTYVNRSVGSPSTLTTGVLTNGFVFR